MSKGKIREIHLRTLQIQMEKPLENHREIADWLWPVSKQIITHEGEHTPTLVFFDSQSQNVVDLGSVFYNKDIAANIMHDIASRPDVYAIAFICESWLVQAKKEEDVSNIIASERPDRIEVIYMTVEMRDLPGYLSRQAAILRDDKENIIGLSDDHDMFTNQTGGRFSNFFTRGRA